MSELTLSVFIEGDLDGFKSTNAKQKFKTQVRNKLNDSSVDLNNIGNHYVKEGYKLNFVSNEDNKVKFNLVKELVKEVKKPDTNKKELLRAKLNMMKNNRTNVEYYKAKNDENVTPEILNAYMQAKKMCKMPIPEPKEILAHPEEHKPLIQMVLSNPMFSKNVNHPYIKYFKLLGDKLGVETVLPIPTQDFTQRSDFLNHEIVNVQGTEMNKDADTDDEN